MRETHTHIPATAEQQHFVENTRESISRVIITMEKVRARIRSQLAEGDFPGRAQLEKSELQMDALFVVLKSSLSQLENAANATWPQDRKKVEDAWEDFIRSINHILVRLN